eukprot:gene14943-16484_t
MKLLVESLMSLSKLGCWKTVSKEFACLVHRGEAKGQKERCDSTFGLSDFGFIEIVKLENDNAHFTGKNDSSVSLRGLLERLDAGELLIGGGGMMHQLEKRCLVKAVKELHREFFRGGADVLQALTFNTSDNCLRASGLNFTCAELSSAACKLAKEVAAESDRHILVAGCLSATKSYTGKDSKDKVQAEFELLLNSFLENDVDFVVAEYICHCEEICWAIETLKKANKPVVAMMNIGPMGDASTSMTTGQCAVKMAEAGADVIGLSCCFDHEQLLKGLKEMKKCLGEAGFGKTHLVCQPLGFWTPDAAKDGYRSLPEFPIATEPRQMTRFDVAKYARDTYDAGIRYIGGCCGFASYHIRAISEELAKERGFLPPGSDKSEPWGGGFRDMPEPWYAQRRDKKEMCDSPFDVSDFCFIEVVKLKNDNATEQISDFAVRAVPIKLLPDKPLPPLKIEQWGVSIVRFAGADVIGLSCCFDHEQLLKGLKEMKKCLREAGFGKTHLVCQPLGFWTPDAAKDGYRSLPECPLATEPRQMTRFDVAKYARDTYDAGIRYIGGCCGFASYHIRAISEEVVLAGPTTPACTIFTNVGILNTLFPVKRGLPWVFYNAMLSFNSSLPKRGDFSHQAVTRVSPGVEVFVTCLNPVTAHFHATESSKDNSLNSIYAYEILDPKLLSDQQENIGATLNQQLEDLIRVHFQKVRISKAITVTTVAN